MADQDLEVRKQKLVTRFKWGIALAAILVIAPLTSTILWGLLGGLALVAGGAVGFIGINLAPVFADKVANWKIKLLVAEAESNPIETMQNIDIERTRELMDKDKYLEDWDTELANYDDELQGIVKDYPEEAPKYKAVSAEMHAALGEARAEQSQARKDLAEFERAIKKAKSLYKIALAAQKVTSFSKSAEEKVLQDIKQQVAFDSVRSNLNRSFARLNTAMEKRQLRPAVTPSALPGRLGSEV